MKAVEGAEVKGKDISEELLDKPENCRTAEELLKVNRVVIFYKFSERRERYGRRQNSPPGRFLPGDGLQGTALAKAYGSHAVLGGRGAG